MITKIEIVDNTNTPLSYICDLNGFENGKTFEFKPGVNIIIGKNGSGKSTLLKLIEKYTLLDKDCHNKQLLSGLFEITNNDIKDGVRVYGDYKASLFRLCHMTEMANSNTAFSSFENFGATYMSMNSSTGEGVLIALQTMFKKMFSTNAKLSFPLTDIEDIATDSNDIWKERARAYLEYIKKNTIDFKEKEYTILIDEPDRNLDIENIKEIYCILGNRKKNTQVIAVIHNPLLIYRLSSQKDINFIEMEPGYLEKIKNEVDYLTNKK